MKVWIFKPTKYWEYCGGAIIIAANSIEDAQKLIDDKIQEEYEKEVAEGIWEHPSKGRCILHREEYLQEPKNDIMRVVDNWILYRVIECPEIKKAEIILEDWNYA